MLRSMIYTFGYGHQKRSGRTVIAAAASVFLGCSRMQHDIAPRGGWDKRRPRHVAPVSKAHKSTRESVSSTKWVI